ncbi:Myosin-cross-reactive_antigen [Hexamita inflata]|uniref:Putative n=1 Tax=Hexamita inflata TaxID=28002 RepID=A0AA86PQG2_9EUKA|nr:Myosin-cross-reactive antigen [Hexamita inflata]
MVSCYLFLIRDAHFTGKIQKSLKISNSREVVAMAPITGALTGNGSVEKGFCVAETYVLAPIYECLHEMFRDIPSIREPESRLHKKQLISMKQ